MKKGLSTRIIEIESKSAANPAKKIPGMSYAINPYIGCAFGCVYCYASFMGRFIGEKNNDWGNYVYVKTNIVELMEKEILKLIKKGQPGVAISTVTDPYQGVERKYRLTRGVLKIFEKHNYRGKIGILTKSPLVLKDLDIIKKIKNIQVGITITTHENEFSRKIEVNAPISSTRLNTLKKLNEAGVKTCAFIGPLLPHMKNNPNHLDKLFSEIKNSGTNLVKIEYLNLPPNVKSRMNNLYKDEMEEVQVLYKQSQQDEYMEEFKIIIHHLLEKNDLILNYSEIVHHRNL